MSDEQRCNEVGWTRRAAVVAHGTLNFVGPLARATSPRCTLRLVSGPFTTNEGCSAP